MDPKQHVENLNFAFSWLIELILKIFVVDVDFNQNLIEDCRPNSKKVVESKKRRTPTERMDVYLSRTLFQNFLCLI